MTAALGAGVLAYTLAEYLFHRFVAHGLAAMPDVHHAAPTARFAAPWCLVPPAAALVYLGAVLCIGPRLALPFVVGVAWTHCWQELVHAHTHRPGAASPLARHHAQHHADPTVNFGHSTTLWDHTFRTYRRGR